MEGAEKMKAAVTKAAIKSLFGVIEKISEERFVSFLKPHLDRMVHPEGREFMQKALVLFKRQYSRFAPNVRKKFVENFVYNTLIKGPKQRRKFAQEHGFVPPTLFVISPTMACNLGCYGCYAGEYTKKDALPLELVNRVIKEGNEMGIYFFVITGGEPFYWDHLLEMYEQNNHCFFMTYTNGTYIDRKCAAKLAELGNVLPCISVEGFEKETDERRGKGHFKRVCDAMDNLREAGVPFAFSATATRENNELVVSEEFVDFYEKKGAILGWYFNYVPIGRKPFLDIMPTPEQRLYRMRVVRELRKKHDILLADFWNDGPLVGGCLAGGRCYLHINSNGDVEPCVFVHFAIDNIKEKSMKEILSGPLFCDLRSRIPYSNNLLTPCQIIDQPWVLRDVVEKHGCRPTHQGAESIVTDFAEFLDDYARKYHGLTDEIWNKEFVPQAPHIFKPVEPIAAEKEKVKV